MDKPDITTKEVGNFGIWYETIDPNFTEISKMSNIPHHWLSFQEVLAGPYSKSVIKPINRYVQRLVPPPTLVSIDNGQVRLRQGNHAEFFLLENSNGSFTHRDRPWQRQYYNTSQDGLIAPENAFQMAFKFYVPWILDENIHIKIEQVEGSPFTIIPTEFNYYKVPEHIQNVEPKFVTFFFNRVGSHMVSDSFGKIPRQSPMFDMVFSANGILIDKVRNFYEEAEHNQVLSTKR
jgi:hypothetical protein